VDQCSWCRRLTGAVSWTPEERSAGRRDQTSG
jgi:hypothetical protein